MKNGWEIKELDEVCDIEYGTRVVNKRDGGTVYPVYGGGGATFFMDTFNREDCLIVARFAMSQMCTRFVNGKFFLNDSGLSLKPKKQNEILQDFLNMQILYLNDYIYSLAKGAAQKNLDVPTFRKTKINFPKSITEQQRIVSILNEAFISIAKAKANAEQNLKNAKELFESYLQNVFEDQNNSLEKKTIGETCDLIDSLHKTPKYIKKGGYPMVRVTEIKYGTLNITNALRVDEDTYKEFSKKHKPKVGDIVFSRVGASFGVSSLVVSNDEFCLGQNTVFIITKSNSKYFYYFLISRIARNQMNKLVAGAAQPTISLKSIKELIIPLPNLKTQEKTVKEIESILIETKRLETIHQNKINNLEELKKSVLQKVFSGQLKLKN